MTPVRWGELKTPGGHLNAEVASALQKEIRRGKEREALYWATELDLAGYSGYCWKRLMIIASEDVGLADSNVAILVKALHDTWLEVKRSSRKGSNPSHGRVLLAHAVIALARAPKSRMLDHALQVMYAGERPQVEMPDYALDKHTRRGARMGRGIDHFIEEGAVIENASAMPDPWKDEGLLMLRLKYAKEGREPDQLEFDDES